MTKNSVLLKEIILDLESKMSESEECLLLGGGDVLQPPGGNNCKCNGNNCSCPSNNCLCGGNNCSCNYTDEGGIDDGKAPERPPQSPNN